jgi:hypothetical protein
LSWFRPGADVFHKSATIPSDLLRRGHVLSPKQLAELYWNSRRMKLTIDWRFRQFLDNGSLYVDSGLKTHVHEFSTASVGGSIYGPGTEITNERSLIRPHPAQISWGRIARSGRPPAASAYFLTYDFGIISSGIWHQDFPDPRVAGLWPDIKARVTVRYGSTITFQIGGNLPGNDITDLIPEDHKVQVGTFTFLDFPPVPMWFLWNGTYSSPAAYFSNYSPVCNMRVEWPSGESYRWPYGDDSDGRYADGWTEADDLTD